MWFRWWSDIFSRIVVTFFTRSLDHRYQKITTNQ
jgi:hypothetical protein